MKAYPIIGETGEMRCNDGEMFPLFGIGNEKRDLVLLVRGDIRVERAVCTSFFGCIHCGYMNTGSAGFHKIEDRVLCTHCECEGTVYYFDGVWKGSWGRIDEGCRDGHVTIEKI